MPMGDQAMLRNRLIKAAAGACAFVMVVSLSNAESTLVSGRALVTDGDTLRIGPVVVRLHGVDAPEAGQVCKDSRGKRWQCGQGAIERLKELAERKELTCDVRDRDRYGRVIAVCSDGQITLNEVMVSEGLAWAFRRYSKDYARLEDQAKAERRGIWQGDAQPPWDFRERAWGAAVSGELPRPDCPIKGNISSSGEHIYHPPWSPWYSRTKINASTGERWFCDEAEAVAAGWRAPN